MKKILIPIDFSKSSNEVISLALSTFADEPCEFNILHTYSYEIYGLDAFSLLQLGRDYFTKDEIKRLGQMLKQISPYSTDPRYARHKFKLLPKTSDLMDDVQEALDQFDIDMFVIGTHGVDSSGICKERSVNRLLNSITNCPVMAIPLNGEAWVTKDLEEIRMVG
jgi:hypothetical protein